MSDIARNNRIKTLTTFLELDPKDSFSRYALALEYINAEEVALAVKEFETLLEHDPEYSATYYQLAKAYVALGKIEEAKKTYQKGIDLTARLGDTHANQELREALLMLSSGH
ncbi:Tetratricopeptide TPR_2 repeat protein [Chloroherpeton thalassium ATCC 35110]|uniref:Tetratricopeptide TPR_2 repeat protein n=1 Tax=Chloroherpeton thalassium (strain ATCC 35110 / GB-78) TaxID=517418 RepID=B3QWQ4_CHLT3|nr:tetratricopeptide repeat protein [Chloroherpeton thalassium]ACF13268.1 Tetratricopeptide TPR_2 repeat protein [Chloroherpeton thalassium ATCC 35110]